MSYSTLPALWNWFTPTNFGESSANTTLNSTGEYLSVIGRVYIPGGGAKTLSAAGGGRIVWRSAGGVVFANGGTLLDIGVQGVDQTTGMPDGSFVVSAQLVGGTDTVAASSLVDTPMESGSISIDDGEEVCVIVVMTTRAGADSVSAGGQQVTIGASQRAYPYGVINTGTPTKSATALLSAVLMFDDGTSGTIYGVDIPASTYFTVLAFNQTSTPDEYCAVFTPPVNIKIRAIGFPAGDIASGDTLELILYQDPLGSPSVLQTVTPDTDVLGAATSAGKLVGYIPETTLTAGVSYGVALRPTSNNNISSFYYDFLSGFTLMTNALSIFGSSLRLAARSDQTGAFSVTQTFHAPWFYLGTSAIDLGSGGSGGGLRLAGHGGLAA